MLDTVTKKRKVSKKTKKSWRKHVDTKDVDSFLENERLDERLGAPFSERKDDELFAVDNTGDDNALIRDNNNLTKKQRRELLKNSEPKCFAILKPHTAVPDPIAKRNRVRTPEERKSSIRKRVEAERKLKGQLKLKERTAIQNRLLAQKTRAEKPKRGDIKDDVWEAEPVIEPELKSEWLTNDTIRHTLTNIGKKRKTVPKSLHKKPSVLPAVNAPHPGTSYNPSYADHQQLLAQVAADEIKLIKEEEHLNRVTSKMFRKVTQNQKTQDNLREMSEGLPLHNKEQETSEDEDNDPNVKSVNPPTRNDKKTLVQRRKQKEQRKLKLALRRAKVEKRKVADIYHLKNLGKQLSKKQEKEKFLREKRLKIQAKKELEPKVLSRNKFEPLEQEFQTGDELSGNLRTAHPAGNLLKDRYKSLQQRNIVAPGTLILKKTKAKVKKYIKADHKIDLKKATK